MKIVLPLLLHAVAGMITGVGISIEDMTFIMLGGVITIIATIMILLTTSEQE